MATSQNGYTVLSGRTTGPTPRLRQWVIPGADRSITLRDGSAGFVLIHFALWFHETIERINLGTYDDWGYANRPIRGASAASNHASGTAIDLNATKHPLGKRGTFTKAQYAKIRLRLAFYRGCIRAGIDYQNRADEMHYELDRELAAVERLARRLVSSPRGKRILAANPGALNVIKS